MGSKPGSVAALDILLRRGWNVQRVVVSRSISHPWVQGPDLATRAFAEGIPVISQSELDFSEKVDFIVSYMFRHRVRPPTLRMATRAALNFHAGMLPEFGGWAFYSVAIVEKRNDYGCTCHHMDEGFDSGPILEVRRFPIVPNNETAWSLERKTQIEMIKLFVDFCQRAECGEELPKQPQDPTNSRYMSRNEFEALKRIPDDADAETIDRLARAFWYPPYECAYYLLGRNKIEVVPDVAKKQCAEYMHAHDLDILIQAVSERLRETKR